MQCLMNQELRQKNSRKHFLFTPTIKCIGVNKMKKFKSYKTLFTLLITLFFVFAFVGIYLGRSHNIRLNSHLFEYYQLVFFLLLFISGPTIYAPFTAFTTVIVFAFVSGVFISGTDLKSGIITFIFDTVLGTLLVQYSAFITLTAIKIFTPTQEELILEGVMFKATRFVGIFNFRYIASYIAFFVFYTLFAYAIVYVKGYILLLI